MSGTHHGRWQERCWRDVGGPGSRGKPQGALPPRSFHAKAAVQATRGGRAASWGHKHVRADVVRRCHCVQGSGASPAPLRPPPEPSAAPETGVRWSSCRQGYARGHARGSVTPAERITRRPVTRACLTHSPTPTPLTTAAITLDYTVAAPCDQPRRRGRKALQASAGCSKCPCQSVRDTARRAATVPIHGTVAALASPTRVP